MQNKHWYFIKYTYNVTLIVCIVIQRLLCILNLSAMCGWLYINLKTRSEVKIQKHADFWGGDSGFQVMHSRWDSWGLFYTTNFKQKSCIIKIQVYGTER